MQTPGGNRRCLKPADFGMLRIRQKRHNVKPHRSAPQGASAAQPRAPMPPAAACPTLRRLVEFRRLFASQMRRLVRRSGEALRVSPLPRTRPRIAKRQWPELSEPVAGGHDAVGGVVGDTGAAEPPCGGDCRTQVSIMRPTAPRIELSYRL